MWWVAHIRSKCDLKKYLAPLWQSPVLLPRTSVLTIGTCIDEVLGRPLKHFYQAKAFLIYSTISAQYLVAQIVRVEFWILVLMFTTAPAWRKILKYIWNSTCPNRWATKDKKNNISQMSWKFLWKEWTLYSFNTEFWQILKSQLRFLKYMN